MMKHVQRPVIGINWTEDVEKLTSIKDIIAYYMHILKQNHPDTQYDVCGYDFGGVLAMELAAQLQAANGDACVKRVATLDTSPDFMQNFANDILNRSKHSDELHIELLKEYVNLFFQLDEQEREQLASDLNSLLNSSECTGHVVRFLNERLPKLETDKQQLNDSEMSEKVQVSIDRFHRKLRMMSAFELSRKLNVKMGLMKCTDSWFANQLDPSYNLAKVSTNVQPFGCFIL